jgi:hypothetical protein
MLKYYVPKKIHEPGAHGLSVKKTWKCLIYEFLDSIFNGGDLTLQLRITRSYASSNDRSRDIAGTAKCSF